MASLQWALWAYPTPPTTHYPHQHLPPPHSSIILGSGSCYVLRSDLCGMHIVPYAPQYQADWKRINVAWIAKSFVVEAVDLEVLDHPQENILDRGGSILLAVEGDAVVGTCALVLARPGVYQMVKMAVDEAWRGHGIGRTLGHAIIEEARLRGGHTLMLYSNRSGSAAAVELYRALGFVEAPLPTQAYARADIYMELPLA